MSELALDFLTLVESHEIRLLSWGFVDGSFTRDELVLLGDEFALKHDGSGTANGSDLLAQLEQRALLLEVPQADGSYAYRTRAAEAIRLLARLRQLFPRNAGAGWELAPGLVADYRLLARPRAYAKRDLSPGALRDALRERGLLTDERAAAIERLTTTPAGKPLELARFQVEATVEILAGLESRRDGGTIVGAGTGSGKTLAFYLPALSHIVSAKQDRGTKVLALYPRIELLRDQFTETYRTARLLDGVGTLGRPIRIGALYGSTPFSATSTRRYWKAAGEGRACPYMPCPHCEEGTLIWTEDRIKAGDQTLVCSHCRRFVPAAHIVLTRDELRKRPPDVLFTTTEMLNRLMADSTMRKVIGIGPGAMPIDLMLLDEVHTYEGSTGAQVAGVLRRWRHMRRASVRFVGLSATLRQAGDFFAQLTGLSGQQVTSIEPRQSDLEYAGQEYLLAVRSNPSSGASVLSTTIQTAMLMQRVLDPLDRDTSEGAFGRRLFAFTDDLDVTNRLYFDLLDAEGLTDFNVPYKAPLASLRSGDGADLPGRRAGGQSWEALERAGHRLDPNTHLRIGRTTSQDAGVDRRATAIVATASLEVGFNDPLVGAVLQHKSPHDAAAFLQRKGRAGRRRGMRPWTVVVLSDYGRDRITYESYQQLFDPELPARTLPVANPAVLRMQATFATLDWLAHRVSGANLWRLLAGPPDVQYAERDRPQQLAVADQLLAVLENSETRADLERHLRVALGGIEESELRELLWDPPRPLLTAVLPTAIRRLQTGWANLELGPGLDFTADGPLPDFIVSRLFGDLALPEIIVVTPPQSQYEEDRREPMRAFQALNVYAPGRVSHRLAIRHGGARHWISPPLFTPETPGDLDIRAFASQFEEVGMFGTGATAARVIRPLVMRVETPPRDVLNSSNGRLRWEVEVARSAPSTQILFPPPSSPLAELVGKVSFYTHGAVAPVEVRRWAREVDVETLTISDTNRGVVRFVDKNSPGVPVGIGLALDVDAVSVELRAGDAVLSSRSIDDAHLRRLRVDLYHNRLAASQLLRRLLGGFEIERVGRALLFAILDRACTDSLDLFSAWDQLRDIDSLIAALTAALARSDGGDSDPQVAARTADALDRFREPGMRAELDYAAGALWGTPTPDWDIWVRRRLASSVGAAFHGAFQAVCPEYDAGELVVDVEYEPDSGTPTAIWLSEQTVGGGGILQEALRRIAEHPRRFFDLIVAAADPSIEETVDFELTRFVTTVAGDAEVADALGFMRAATTNEEQQSTFDALLATLDRAGVFTCHAVVAALSVRFLRPGSGPRTDAAARELLERWTALEQRFGIEIELNSFAHLDSQTDAFDRTSGLAAPPEQATAWRIGQITSLLWPRGGAARASALAAPNPFTTQSAPDVALMRELLPTRITGIDVADASAALANGGPLARDGDLEIVAPPEGAATLRRAILEAAATAVESGPMLHYPRVDGVRRVAGALRARLVLELIGE